ncbi:hypothetical protein [Synechococcus sp. CCAP 1479/10]|uniref:hypothetical protein n=1 Tax=Synechococcus sp. CCAP 1479/10 TaxID=1221594 RepID=UPI001C23C507|nr:hypothetical protein [Synechococcus sp. CCAP 1479/10]
MAGIGDGDPWPGWWSGPLRRRRDRDGSGTVRAVPNFCCTGAALVLRQRRGVVALASRGDAC